VDKVDKSLLGADLAQARSELRASTDAILLTNLVSHRTRVCWWLSRKLGGRSVFGKRDERLYKQTVTIAADSPITRERPRDAGTSGAAT
jgi:hypothetical protein